MTEKLYSIIRSNSIKKIYESCTKILLKKSENERFFLDDFIRKNFEKSPAYNFESFCQKHPELYAYKNGKYEFIPQNTETDYIRHLDNSKATQSDNESHFDYASLSKAHPNDDQYKTSTIEGVLSSVAINQVANDLGFVKRNRSFDASAFIKAAIDFYANGSTASSKNTIEQFRVDYYLKYANNPISHGGFFNHLNRPELLELMTVALCRISEYSCRTSSIQSTRDLLNSLRSELGLIDIIAVDGSISNVRPSCKNNFKCNALGKRTRQRDTDSENAQIKFHICYSFLANEILSATFTEGTGSERECINNNFFPPLVLFILDRGYISYLQEQDFIARGQYYLIRYRTNVNDIIKTAYDENGNEIPELVGRKVTDPMPASVKAKIIDIDAIRTNEDDQRVVRIVKVKNINADPNEDLYSYYGTNLPREIVPAKVVYLLYRSRWVGTEIPFKGLKSGNDFQSINSSKKHIVLAFYICSMIATLVKKILAMKAKSCEQLEREREKDPKKIKEFSTLRINMGITITPSIINALVDGKRSSFYYAINNKNFKSRLVERCERTPASKRDIENFSDFPSNVKTIIATLTNNTSKMRA